MLGRFHHESTSHHLRASMDQLIAIFCDIDDFCKAFEPVSYRHLLRMGQRQRTRQTTWPSVNGIQLLSNQAFVGPQARSLSADVRDVVNPNSRYVCRLIDPDTSTLLTIRIEFYRLKHECMEKIIEKSRILPQWQPRLYGGAATYSGLVNSICTSPSTRS